MKKKKKTTKRKTIKPIPFMNMPRPRPLKNTKFNNAPLKGLNIVNIRSKNTFNNVPRRAKQFIPLPQMIKKESTRQKSPLSRWGDADMDGKVNFLDCSPRNVGDDGFFGDMIDKVKGMFSRKSKEERTIDKKEKVALSQARGPERIEQLKAKAGIIKTAIRTDEGKAEKKKGGPLSKREEDIIRTQAMKRERIKEYFKKEKERTKAIKKARMKQRILPGVLKLSPGIMSYTKRSKEKQRKLSRSVLNIASAAVPGKVAGARQVYGTGRVARKSGPKRPVGRPKGSFKHHIPGRGLVSGAEHDVWEKKQKFKGQVGTVGGPKPIYRTEPPKIQTAEPEVMTAESMDSEIQAVTQPVAAGPQNGYAAAIKARQMQEQRDDNVLNVAPLHAPDVMKGEMVGQAPEDNILNAPNINEGGMRNVQGERVEGVELGDRPQTNPHGDEYLEIEPGSGKAFVKQRINEKWATGEAL